MRQATVLTAADHGASNTGPRSILLVFCGLLAIAMVGWQVLTVSGHPKPLSPSADASPAILNIGVLVFREGLECVLVLAAVVAGNLERKPPYRRSVAAGVVAGFLATLLTWTIAVRVLNDLSTNVSALALQAGTGLLAVVVLLVVMNWFFHKVYWTGWISAHNRRKRELLGSAETRRASSFGLLCGMGVLGFTSFYREGFEVVLFLQSYRLRLGSHIVLWGVSLGILLSGIVAILTFAAHRKLPYRRMLVLTGVLLGIVLIVMVGEQAQEMQLAHWIPTTELPWLAPYIPNWTGLWFSLFPTVETLLAQVLAVLLVLGSYVFANRGARMPQS